MNIELREIVELKAEEFKKKEYSQLQQIVEKKGEYFQVEYKNKKYNIEIDAEYFKGNNIRVRVQGEKNTLFGNLSGFARYFAKSSNGDFIEQNDEIIF